MVGREVVGREVVGREVVGREVLFVVGGQYESLRTKTNVYISESSTALCGLFSG